MKAYFVQGLIVAKQDLEELKRQLENVLSIYTHCELWEIAPIHQIIKNGSLENAKNIAKFELLNDEYKVLKERVVEISKSVIGCAE